jgi:general secretion pathway protein G
MLAVVLILVIVAGIGFVVVNNQIEKSRERTDVANVRTIADAVQRYMMEETESPDGDVDEEHALIEKGYLAAPPSDPWGKGNKYHISSSGQDITITGVKASDPPEVTLEGAIPDGG